MDQPARYVLTSGHLSGAGMAFGRHGTVVVVHFPDAGGRPVVAVGRCDLVDMDREGSVAGLASRLLSRRHLDVAGLVRTLGSMGRRNVDAMLIWGAVGRHLGSRPPVTPLPRVAEVEECVTSFDGGRGVTLSGSLSTGVRALDRHVTLDHMSVAVASAGMALIREHLPDTGQLSLPEALVAMTLASLPNPAWVAQGLVAAPFLRRLLHSASPEEVASCPHLAALARGKAPLEVVGALVCDLTRDARWPLPDGFRVTPAALRSVAAFDETKRLARALLPCILAFHAAHPAHRSLDPTEVWALHLNLMRFDVRSGLENLSAVAVAGAATCALVVRSMLDAHGRVQPLAWGYGDAITSLITSVRAIVGATATPDASGRLAGAIVARTLFAPGRRLSGHVRVDAEWHADVARHLRAIERVREEVTARVGGMDVEDPYPHVLEGPLRLGRVTVTPMLTHGDYLREGEEMAHCIGTFARLAWTGGVASLSVADDDGERSSASCTILPDGRLRIREHKGVRNGPPPQGHVAAVAEVVRLASVDLAVTGRLATQAGARASLTSDEVALRLMDAAERARFVDAHFAVVSHWLGTREVRMGPVAWLATMRDAIGPIREDEGGKGPLARLARWARARLRRRRPVG